jgi:hypothetical protein
MEPAKKKVDLVSEIIEQFIDNSLESPVHEWYCR